MAFRFPTRGSRRPDRLAEPMLPFGETFEPGTVDPVPDRRGPAPPDAEGIARRARESQAVSVSTYVVRLNSALKSGVPECWVRGEVSEFKVWNSGHAYFTLKDATASLAAMMWSDDVAALPFRVEEGMEVLARGAANVYPAKGRLSFVASELQPYGLGALQLALEQLKRKLAAEGLFDAARKRPLPLLPRCIGVVTSARGAAVRDILKVLGRRFPNAHVTIFPVAVQGPSAPLEISRAVRSFSKRMAADVVIVARGGGSREDLAAFNDERVVRAVAASLIPTIAAVGHEIDVSLTDLAADVRAATPSQAAELVVARREELESSLAAREKELSAALRARLQEAGESLRHASGVLTRYEERVRREAAGSVLALRALVSAVRNLPAAFAQRLTAAEREILAWPDRVALPHLATRLKQDERALADRLAAQLNWAGEQLGRSAGQLASLDPLRVLARGYSVVYKAGETAPLVDASRVAPGDALSVRLARGNVKARVTEVTPSTEPS